MGLWRESNVKATRKRHRCDGCERAIDAGSSAWRFVGMNIENDFCSSIMHHECRAAEVALNKLMDAAWDEWTPLVDRDPEDDAWLLAEHPVAANRLGIVAPALLTADEAARVK